MLLFAFSTLVCRDVTSGGVTASLSIVDLSVSCDTDEFKLLLVCAFLVEMLYSVGFPLFLMLVSKPDLRRKIFGGNQEQRRGAPGPAINCNVTAEHEV